MPGDSDEDFGALLAQFEKEQPQAPRRKRDPKLGETVKGKVVTIGHDAVFVDLGAKAEGMIDIIELRDENGKLRVAIGDTVEGRVVETSGKAGCIVLHTLGPGHVAKAELEQAAALGLPVEGLVTGVNKGGVEVTVSGVRGFCPISQLDIRHVEDASSYVGQRLVFKITRHETKNLVLSRRALLEEEQRRAAAATRERLVPGAVLRGKVSSLKDYGAFIDLGGIEGMVHVSELGFARVTHPKDVLTVGQEVEVAVLRIEKSDDPRKPEKVALSLKSLAKDPWDEAADRWVEGARATGTVARVEQFGAFVELAPGVEGLVHVSEMGQKKLKRGETVRVAVLGLDRERRRISLGLATDDDGGDPAEAPAAPQRLGTLADLLKSKAGKK